MQRSLSSEILRQIAPDELLDKMVQGMQEVAEAWAKEGNSEIPAFLEGFGIQLDGPEQFILPLVIDEHRYELMHLIGKTIAGKGLIPLAVGMISEGWYLDLTPEEYAKQKESGTFVPPSQHPDRKEALTVVAMSFDGRVSSIYTPFERDADNHIVWGEKTVVALVGRKPGTETSESALLVEFFRGAQKGVHGLTLDLLDQLGRTSGNPARVRPWPPVKKDKSGLPGSEQVM